MRMNRIKIIIKMNKIINIETQNKKNLNWFEKFVLKHEEWRTPIIESQGNMFTKYDVFSGYAIIMGIVTWILFNFILAFNFFLIGGVLYFFNRITFKKKKNKKK